MDINKILGKKKGKSTNMIDSMLGIRKQNIKTIRKQDDRWNQLKDFINSQNQFTIYSNYLDKRTGYKRRKIKLISLASLNSDDIELTGGNLFTYGANLRNISPQTARVIKYAKEIINFAKRLYGNDYLGEEESSGYIFHLNFDMFLKEY